MEDEVVVVVSARESRSGLGYIYGDGKLGVHAMAMSIVASVGVGLIWAKITNTYGPGEICTRFVNTIIRKILSGESLQFTTGTQNSDFVYGENGISYEPVEVFCTDSHRGVIRTLRFRRGKQQPNLVRYF